MNKQLIIVGIIIVIFFTIFWSSITNSFKKETFNSRYPSSLIESHKKYIDDSSNRYNKIYYEIEKLSSFEFDKDFSEEGGCLFIDYLNNNSHPFKRLSEIDNINIYSKLREALQIYINYINEIPIKTELSESFNIENKRITLKYEDLEKDSIYVDNRSLILGLLRLYLYYVTENCDCLKDNRESVESSFNLFDFEESTEKNKKLCKIIHVQENMCNSFRNIRQKYEVYINNKFKPKIDSSFRVLIKSEQEFILENFLKSLLADLINFKINLSLDELPCIFYDDKTCPGHEFLGDKMAKIQSGKQFYFDKNGTKITLASTADINNITRCDLVGPDGNKKCVDVKDRYQTDNCDIMTGYGKEQCERLIYTGIGGKKTNCVYDDKSQRCVNTQDERFNTTNLNYNCLNIDNKDNCDEPCVWNNGINKCLNKLPTKEQNNLACYSKSKETIKLDEEIKSEIKDFGCEDLKMGDDKSSYTFFKHKDSSEVSCSDINNIMNLIPDVGELRKNLCELNPKDWKAKDKDKKYCKYHEYIKHGADSSNNKISVCEAIPDDYKSKKKTNLYLARFKSEADCNERLGMKWDSKNNRCVSLDLTKENCNTIIDKTICDYHDKCIWQKSPVDTASINRGYCRDLSRQLSDIEETIENIHDNYIRKEIKLENIQRELLNNMDSIQNNIAKRVK